MTIIYELCSRNERTSRMTWGAWPTREKAAERWASHADLFAKYWPEVWIEEIDTTGMFKIPGKRTPRQRYKQNVEQLKPERAGTWNKVSVEIKRGNKVAGSYMRNYPGHPPFEPFRQGKQDYALISPRYTGTSVMDLRTGEIIAAEEPSSQGFCPVGFYVPDWWDVNDGSIIPGSTHWDHSDEWPTGQFGFVWGCVWGDDSSWKVQYLDLSRVSEGTITRDERFGYVELHSRSGEPREFIQCSWWGNDPSVTFAVDVTYLLPSGAAR